MRKKLIPFGLACRAHRARRRLVMADQAEYFRCSVSRISAVERGEEENLLISLTSLFTGFSLRTKRSANKLQMAKVIRRLPTKKSFNFAI